MTSSDTSLLRGCRATDALPLPDRQIDAFCERLALFATGAGDAER